MQNPSKQMLMIQKLNPLPEYNKVIKFLNNETMLQTLVVMMPDFKDEQYNITKRCYFVAITMGLITDEIYL